MKEVINVNNENITVKNNKIYINGIEYVPKNKSVNEVEFKGSVNNLDSDCSFTVNGDINGNLDVGGSVYIKGSVAGDIDCGGSVMINGLHKGDIDAGGSVSINN